LCDQFVDCKFRLRIGVACGLVQDQYPGKHQKSPRKGNTLTLSSGEVKPAFSHQSVVSVGEPRHELIDPRRSGGGVDIINRRGGVAETDVVGNAAVNQADFLWNVYDLGAESSKRKIANVHTIKKDAAGRDIEEACNQVDESCFSGSALAGDADA